MDPLNISAITRKPNLADEVSEQLLAAIRSAGLAPGSRIPSERELGEKFGVSRTVVREATRHLAAKGVLQVVGGAGVVVADVGGERVRESLDLYFSQRADFDPQKIFEVRETLELRTVELAATRADAASRERIMAACERMAEAIDDPAAASIADVEFHREIAIATGNELFPVLVDSLSGVLYDIRLATLGEAGRGEVALAAHRRVAEAIARGDRESAVEAMRDHLEDSRVALARVLPPPPLA